MNDSDRKHFEQRLQQERARIQEALRQSDETARTSALDDGDLTNYSQHQADDGTDTMEQEKALMLLSQETALLSQVDAALERLINEPENFGRCAECGTELEKERLELLPWATHCVECQSALENG
jgi:DnaK suppressor protein